METRPATTNHARVPAVSPALNAANSSSTPNAIAQIAMITTSATAVMFG
jgi:hypothetical protein